MMPALWFLLALGVADLAVRLAVRIIDRRRKASHG